MGWRLVDIPVAPNGCPLDISPPLGLTTYLPPYVLSPLSTNKPPLPIIIPCHYVMDLSRHIGQWIKVMRGIL